MRLVSFFSGAGGLDLGFQKAGFDVLWANEYDRDIWETFEKNHIHTKLDRRSITEIPSHDVPDCDGIIGGPPCQSWSAGGALRGIEDKRGQLFYDFIRILKDKKPKFFLAENVAGMLLERHKFSLENFKMLFDECGYNLSVTSINAADYGIPQDRKRLFFVGYRKDLGIKFKFPAPFTKKNGDKRTLQNTISDLKDTALPAVEKDYTNGKNCIVANHEFMTGGFSSMYLSRNRVRGWNEVSFTIQAGGRHAPIHPQAPKMPLIDKDLRGFAKGHETLYRRLTVRECARIQTFPDNFIFHYKKLTAGYKMIGNAVPVDLATIIASQISEDLKAVNYQKSDTLVA